ncbi:MAG TPA: glycosyltransferase, partial [Gemmatales bacterium]|nr:glycosyltransferase [Gemmatales bacterium]
MHRCLSMLHRTVPRAEIILVDNGSKDYQTRKLIEEARVQRQARLLRIDEEFNYSKLCNAGAAESQRELLLFLNNDVLAMQPAWLQAMLEVLNDQTVGIVGATLLYPDRTLQHVGLAPTGPSGAWVHPYRYEPESCTGFQHELRHIRTVPAVTGA